MLVGLSVTCVYKYPRSPEEGTISSKVGVTGRWEGTPVCWHSSQCSQSLNLLCGPDSSSLHLFRWRVPQDPTVYVGRAQGTNEVASASVRPPVSAVYLQLGFAGGEAQSRHICKFLPHSSVSCAPSGQSPSGMRTWKSLCQQGFP